MKEKTVKDHQGKEHPADTARQGGAAYAPHNESAEELAEGVGALEDAADIHGHLPIRVHDVGSVAHQSADLADVARPDVMGSA